MHKKEEDEGVGDLASLDPSSFSYDLLEAAFWEHHGPGDGTLLIGGIEVTKTVTPYRSNSGKSTSYKVTFTFEIGGEARSMMKASRFEGNRRNDPNRSWGRDRD